MRILSEEMIPIAYEFNDIWFWICVLAGFILIEIIVILCFNDIPGYTIFFISVLILLFSIFIGILLGGGFFATPSEYENHYKVIVDDTITVNEFLDQYEILERDGEILIVKEIEVEVGDE